MFRFCARCFTKFCGGEAELFLEEAAEGTADVEAGGGGHLVDAHLGTGGYQFAGMVETQLVDVVGNAGVLAALAKNRTDIPRRNLEIGAGGLTVEMRVEVELLLLDDVKNTLHLLIPFRRI